jgi:hypothetical protein
MADDFTLGIGAKDRGARQLIRDLIVALGGLKAAQLENARITKEAAAAAQAEADALKKRVALAQQALAQRQQEAAAEQQLSQQNIANAKREAEEREAAARRIAAANNQEAASVRAAAQSSVQAAAQSLATTVANQKALVAAVEQGVKTRIRRQTDLAAAEEAQDVKNIARLERTLKRLKQVQQQEKDANDKRIADARKSVADAQAVRDATKPKTIERTVADVTLSTRKDDLALIKEQAAIQNKANAAASQRQAQLVKEEKEFAAQRSAANKKAAAEAEATGKKEIKAAQDKANGIIAAEAKILKTRESEAKVATKAATDIERAGNKQIAAAQRQGSAGVKVANQQAATNNRLKNAAVQNANVQVNAAQRIAVAAQRAANAQAAAAQKAVQALQQQARAIPGLNSGLSSLRRTVLQLVTAYGGFRAISGFVKTGLEFNTLIESAKLGIAALITAEATLTNEQGKQLQGLEALRAAQGLAGDQLNKLRIAGIQTAATTENLVTAFQEAVGAGVAVGLTLDQIRKFSVSVAQAASAINLPMNQLQQETRSILQGTIDRNSRIAKALNLTNAMVNQAKAEGRLFDLLNEKFKAFNIAGAESVKTFAALGSNIKDAFQVLAGAAVQPLFVRLRDAGQEALRSIFDFDTASIQKSFQGLVDGAKIMFDELGKAFADAISDAVRGATALAQWLALHRQQVKETAAAIGSMVREFGRMVVSIGEAIRGLIELAGGTNAVITAARILQGIFKAIREDAGLIVALLAGGALITALKGITTIIVALRAVMAGAAAGSLVAPGVGTAVGAVVGGLLTLHSLWNIYKGDQQAAAEETARTTTAVEDQTQKLAELTAEYNENARILRDSKLSDEEKVVVQKRLNEIRDEFIRAGGAYRDIFNQDKVSVDNLAESLRGLLRAQADAAVQRESDARGRLFDLQQALRLAEATKAKTARRDPLGLGFLFDPKAVSQVKAIQDQIRVAEAEVQRFSTVTDGLTASLDQAAQASVKVKAQEPAKPDATGEDPRIRQARAEFERTKAELDLRRAQIARDLAARRITNEQSLEQLLDADLAEAEAEFKFIEARKAEAERRIRVSKPGSAAQRDARDALAAIEIEEAANFVRRQQKTEEFNAAILDLTQKRADEEAAIEVRALRAQGKSLDAALLEIDRETQAALDKAEQQFAEFSPEIQAKLKIAITHEQLEKAVKAVQEEINRIIQTRTEEERTAREDFTRRGDKSIAAQQQLATRVAAANGRAAAAAGHAREELLKLRDEAKDDPTVSTFIGRLLAELDTLTAKAQEVDIEMQRLREGLREALTSGLANFFDSLTDSTVSLAQSFKNMVNSILHDMSRLVSQLLAQRIITSILGGAAGAAGAGEAGAGAAAAGAAAGGAARGGQAIQYRAAGGPGRPAHGALHGGVAGIDSIPILAMPEEYFVRREAVRRYGVEFFDLLNNMQLPTPVLRGQNRFKFAQGGVVDGSSFGARSPVRQEVHHTIGVDSRGLLHVLEGKPGQDAVAKATKARRREISRVLAPQRRP